MYSTSTHNSNHLTEELLLPLKSVLQVLPTIVVSSCLMGEKVRYDGKHKRQDALYTLFSPFLKLEAFCPEMAAGMGVPREPIQWVEFSPDDRRVQQVTKPHTQYQAPLKSACEQRLLTEGTIDGAILKARSPSCGLGSASIISIQGEPLRHIDGLWVQHLKTHRPNTLIADESLLGHQANSIWFIALLYVRQLARQGDSAPSLGQLPLNLETSEVDRLAIYQQLRRMIDQH